MRENSYFYNQKNIFSIMNKKIFLPFLLIVFSGMMLSATTFAQANKSVKPKTQAKKVETNKQKPGTRIKIRTDMGSMIVRLYDETPLHRDNFIALVKKGFYDSLMFHRIIPQFMIQGGDPMSKNADASAMLGSGGGDMERIPAEFRPTLFHKRGALAAARDGNPQKASSACQFYIVQGKPYSLDELNMMERQSGRTFTAIEKEVYTTEGGTPFLDQNYTVFGEVESGWDVIDKIVAAPRNSSDRPLKDIRMYMEIMK